MGRTLDRLGGLWAGVFGSDPGLLRLRNALRATLAVILTAALFGFLVFEHRLPVIAAAVGASFALMATALAREPDPRERAISVLAMAGAAGVSTALAAFLARWPLVAEAGFLVCVAATVAVQSWGPRFIGIGTVALLDFYLVLYLKAAWTDIAPAVLTLPVALGVVLMVGFWLVPERPAESLGRLMGTARRNGAALLRAIADRADPGAEEAGERLRRRRLFAELNNTILVAEERLALIDPGRQTGLGLALMRFELALTEAAAAAGAAPLKRADRARLRLGAMRLRAGTRSHLRPRGEGAGAQLSSAALVHVEEAAQDLVVPSVLPSMPVNSSPTAVATRPPLAWRAAARAGGAALVAMAGGYALSPNRWFWSVQTAYIMFLGTRSRGDTLVRSLQRIWGTLAGLLAGLLASAALSAHPVAQAAGILACLFAAAHSFGASQTLSVFFITVILSLAYSLGGAPTWTVLTLRLEETAIGAAAAVIAGFAIFPKSTHDHVEETGAKVLSALAGAVRASAGRLAGDRSALPSAAMRAADRALRDLRAALAPLRAGRALTPWAKPEAELPAVLACAFWVRVLASESEAAGDHSPEEAEHAERLAAKLDALAGPGDRQPEDRPADAPDGDLLFDLRHEAGMIAAVLDNLEGAVDRLDRRLRADGWTALVAKRPL